MERAGYIASFVSAASDDDHDDDDDDGDGELHSIHSNAMCDVAELSG